MKKIECMGDSRRLDVTLSQSWWYSLWSFLCCLFCIYFLDLIDHFVFAQKAQNWVTLGSNFDSSAELKISISHNFCVLCKNGCKKYKFPPMPCKIGSRSYCIFFKYLRFTKADLQIFYFKYILNVSIFRFYGSLIIVF